MSPTTSGFGRFAGLYCAASRLIDKLQPLLLLRDCAVFMLRL